MQLEVGMRIRRTRSTASAAVNGTRQYEGTISSLDTRGGLTRVGMTDRIRLDTHAAMPPHLNCFRIIPDTQQIHEGGSVDVLSFTRDGFVWRLVEDITALMTYGSVLRDSNDVVGTFAGDTELSADSPARLRVIAHSSAVQSQWLQAPVYLRTTQLHEDHATATVSEASNSNANQETETMTDTQAQTPAADGYAWEPVTASELQVGDFVRAIRKPHLTPSTREGEVVSISLEHDNVRMRYEDNPSRRFNISIAMRDFERRTPLAQQWQPVTLDEMREGDFVRGTEMDDASIYVEGVFARAQSGHVFLQPGTGVNALGDALGDGGWSSATRNWARRTPLTQLYDERPMTAEDARPGTIVRYNDFYVGEIVSVIPWLTRVIEILSEGERINRDGYFDVDNVVNGDDPRGDYNGWFVRTPHVASTPEVSEWQPIDASDMRNGDFVRRTASTLAGGVDIVEGTLTGVSDDVAELLQADSHEGRHRYLRTNTGLWERRAAAAQPEVSEWQNVTRDELRAGDYVRGDAEPMGMKEGTVTRIYGPAIGRWACDIDDVNAVNDWSLRDDDKLQRRASSSTQVAAADAAAAQEWRTLTFGEMRKGMRVRRTFEGVTVEGIFDGLDEDQDAWLDDAHRIHAGVAARGSLGRTFLSAARGTWEARTDTIPEPPRFLTLNDARRAVHEFVVSNYNGGDGNCRPGSNDFLRAVGLPQVHEAYETDEREAVAKFFAETRKYLDEERPLDVRTLDRYLTEFGLEPLSPRTQRVTIQATVPSNVSQHDIEQALRTFVRAKSATIDSININD